MCLNVPRRALSFSLRLCVSVIPLSGYNNTATCLLLSLLEDACLSSVLGVVSLILVSGSNALLGHKLNRFQMEEVNLSLCFYPVTKGGPYCFLTQTLYQLSFYFLSKPDEVVAIYLLMVPVLSVAWLGTIDFIALTCNWIFPRISS